MLKNHHFDNLNSRQQSVYEMISSSVLDFRDTCRVFGSQEDAQAALEAFKHDNPQNFQCALNFTTLSVSSNGQVIINLTYTTDNVDETAFNDKLEKIVTDISAKVTGFDEYELCKAAYDAVLDGAAGCDNIDKQFMQIKRLEQTDSSRYYSELETFITENGSLSPHTVRLS